MSTAAVSTAAVSTERADLLESLARHRHFLRFTAQGLTDDQARRRTTVSELTVGGLVKHVAATEEMWVRFIVEGTGAMPSMTGWDEEVAQQWAAEHVLLPAETLAGALERYEEVARRTDEVVRTLPSLDVAHPLPEAPWFEPGASWSARRALLHVIAETAQHAGHADIVREALDGQKTMG
ncbi:DinB family protein [Kineococcus glutinatus]|uniref:DinB family protein n=1 Tax=Kineococcus glutinatus TaxID=1070872 RepID=UPI003CD0B059